MTKTRIYKSLSALVLFLWLGSAPALAQYGVQYSYLSPAGDNVYIFNPASGIALTYTTGVIDTSRTRFNFSIGYYKLSPTQDSFPNYRVSNGKLYPGYDIVKNFVVFPLSAGIEYHPFEGRLNPYVGIDLNVSIISYSYHDYIENLQNDDKSETDWALGLYPKIGLGYVINQNWLVAAGIGYNFELAGSSSANNQSFVKSFLSLSYYLSRPTAKQK